MTYVVPNNKSKEPAVALGVSTGTVAAVSYLILRYIPGIDSETLNAVFVIIAAVLPLVTSFLIRKEVWSPNSVQKLLDKNKPSGV